MARPGRPERNRAARSFRQLRRFHRGFNSDNVFGTHTRRFSERYYGRFERRIPLQDVNEDKVSASFKKGVLTIAVPKSAEAKCNVRRIAINRNG
jgi:hypothetical protein